MKEKYVAFNILSMVGQDSTFKQLSKSMEPEELEKAIGHKYFKREGTPGNYKYYYTEAEYKQAKGESETGLDIKVGQKYHSPAPQGGEAIDFIVKKVDNGKYTIETTNEEGRKGEHTFDEKTIKELISESKLKESGKEDKGSFENEIKVGDKIKGSSGVTKDKIGTVTSINGDMAQVDFGGGDKYGITLRRIKEGEFKQVKGESEELQGEKKLPVIKELERVGLKYKLNPNNKVNPIEAVYVLINQSDSYYKKVEDVIDRYNLEGKIKRVSDYKKSENEEKLKSDK